MSKPCKICSSSQIIQDRVITLKNEGLSLRNIEAELKSLFDFKIASSSIGHHLNKCLKLSGEQQLEEAVLKTLEELAEAPPENDMTRYALRNLLAKALVKFDQRMDETTQTSTPYNMHLETFKCLETLVNIQDKLYPPLQGTGESGSLREKSYNVLNSLSEEERQTLIGQDRQFS
jgi:hypothetical protein